MCVQASGFGTLRPAGAASAVWLLSELSSQVDTDASGSHCFDYSCHNNKALDELIEGRRA